ncbi:MAG: low molecular weight phosphotyrosine protein phosphatase, partial [Rhodospirillales bacterium]|nr:low molecular weight phosphotyrosine protein phosphatase [Rhodospirillales bacterium]
MIRILFVCTGNICRSSTAEGVFRHLVAEAGLADKIAADSVGLEGWHVGSPPDSRSIRAAARRGVDLSDLRAR